jgi:hypothetical protein
LIFLGSAVVGEPGDDGVEVVDGGQGLLNRQMEASDWIGADAGDAYRGQWGGVSPVRGPSASATGAVESRYLSASDSPKVRTSAYFLIS